MTISAPRRALVAAAALLTVAGLTAALPQPAGAFARAWTAVRPACARSAQPGGIRCFAQKLVTVPSGTADASPVRPLAVGHGPTGGYSPADLSRAYGYSRTTKVHQTVAIVDWYDDPHALADLNHFDRHYGFPTETSTSFRKVNQRGRTSPLPKANADLSGEISLDMQAVRGVCATCRILLVEADKATSNDLAEAENTAAHLHATEISNSWGGPENTTNATLRAAFRHQGVVITASTGDDGWFGWDFIRQGGTADNAASFPSTSPYVVAVGGTQLTLTSSGTRSSEVVWNRNGPGSDEPDGDGGATGGGCSRTAAAPGWQSHAPGYAAARCSSHRLAADISVLADPMYGYDVYDTVRDGRGGGTGWARFGGTSLSAPVVAAMYALAGGSGGSSYPAASLYVNVNTRKLTSARYDVVSGANAYCGSDSPETCSDYTSYVTGYTNNPNGQYDESLLDCSYPHSSRSVGSVPSTSSECNAKPGLDGPSGLGTPVGLRMFADTSPGAAVHGPTRLRPKATGTFSATLRPLAGARITSVAWSWGDGGTSTGTTASARHRYSRAGTYVVAMSARDSLYQYVLRRMTVTVR